MESVTAVATTTQVADARQAVRRQFARETHEGNVVKLTWASKGVHRVVTQSSLSHGPRPVFPSTTG
jgi:hypothetical protein